MTTLVRLNNNKALVVKKSSGRGERVIKAGKWRVDNETLTVVENLRGGKQRVIQFDSVIRHK